MKEICSICHEKLDSDTTKTNCNHIYHKNCLDIWLKNNNSCPLCRNSLSTSKIKHKTQTIGTVTSLSSNISSSFPRIFQQQNVTHIFQQQNLTHTILSETSNNSLLPDPIYVRSPWPLESITPSLRRI